MNNLVYFLYASLIQVAHKSCFYINQNFLRFQLWSKTSLNCRIAKFHAVLQTCLPHFLLTVHNEFPQNFAQNLGQLLTHLARRRQSWSKSKSLSSQTRREKNHIKPIKVSNSFEQVFCHGVQSAPYDTPTWRDEGVQHSSENTHNFQLLVISFSCSIFWQPQSDSS